ncbi:MAG: hypothetical protein MZV70_43805 [Desulfobacterales bacterium]|nr:hypothetical protein [Desulfobacterales bacterium]
MSNVPSMVLKLTDPMARPLSLPLQGWVQRDRDPDGGCPGDEKQDGRRRHELRAGSNINQVIRRVHWGQEWQAQETGQVGYDEKDPGGHGVLREWLIL